jgi:hypothetical protein
MAADGHPEPAGGPVDPEATKNASQGPSGAPGGSGRPIPCRQCPTCPFIPGQEREGWHPGARTALAAMVSGDAVTSLTAPFMECHDVPRSVCAGFARTIGHESVKLRLFVSRRRLTVPPPMPGAVRSFAELDARCAGAKNWN